MPANRRQFLQTSALGAGALAFTPSLTPLSAAAAGELGPRRFVFIRKSNGVRFDEVALPTFSEAEKSRDRDKEAMEVDLHKHELPKWLQALTDAKQHLSILQGLSCMMSENGHWSYSSVMGVQVRTQLAERNQAGYDRLRTGEAVSLAVRSRGTVANR